MKTPLTPEEKQELTELREMRWAGELTDRDDILRYDALVERENS